MGRMVDPDKQHTANQTIDWVPQNQSELYRNELNLQIVVTFFLLLAIWAYLMAQMTNPGRIDYQDQKHLKVDELNERLFDWIMFSAK